MLVHGVQHASRRWSALLPGWLDHEAFNACKGAIAHVDLTAAACSTVPEWTSTVLQSTDAAARRSFTSRQILQESPSSCSQHRSASAAGSWWQLAHPSLSPAGSTAASIADGRRLAARHDDLRVAAAARLVHGATSPPSTPEPEKPPALSTAPTAAGDLYDEADHARLAHQLEDQHGPAEHPSGVEDAGRLSGEGPHSARNIADAANILRVNIMPAHVRREADVQCSAARNTQRTIAASHSNGLDADAVQTRRMRRLSNR